MSHEMTLQDVHSSGTEDWYCPICGKRFLVQWSPYNMVVLCDGDIRASHRGGTVGFSLTSHIETSETEDMPLSGIWELGIDEIDFSGLE